MLRTGAEQVATIGAEHNGVGPASTGLDPGVDERIVDVLGVPDPDVAIGGTSGEPATGTIESESHHMASGPVRRCRSYGWSNELLPSSFLGQQLPRALRFVPTQNSTPRICVSNYRWRSRIR
jgi:hypothetical protein